MGAKSSRGAQVLRPLQWETPPSTPLPDVVELHGIEAERAWRAAHNTQRHPPEAWEPTAAGGLYELA